MVDPWNSRPTTAQPRSSCGGSLLRIFVLALVFGSAGYFARPTIERGLAQLNGGSSTDDRAPMIAGNPPISILDPQTNVKLSLVSDSARWMPDITGDELADVLAQSYNDGRYSLVALDGEAGTLVWAAELGNEPTSYVVPGATMTLVVREREVRAFQTADGAFGWVATLPDKITVRYPDPVIFVLADTAVIQSNDNVLTGFALQTGAQTWQTTLKEQYAQNLTRLADMACTDESYTAERALVMECYDLQTGAPGQTYELAPSSSDDVKWWPDPTSAEYFYRSRKVYDQPLEILRVKVADGSSVWTQTLPAPFERLDDFTFRASTTQVALAANDQIAILRDGGTPVLVTQAENRLFPIGFDDDSLYILAVKLRGSSTFTIQQVDSASGAIRWRSEPLGEVNVSIVERDGPGLAIIPKQGVIVGWRDSETTTAIHTQFFSVTDGSIAWELDQNLFIGYVPQIARANNRVLVTVRNVLIVVDARTGAVQWRIDE